MAHSGAWRGLGGHLRDLLTFRVFDLPGHGRSPDWAGGDYQTVCVDEALALLDGQPAHLLGHSYGASVVLRLAVQHPHLAKSLTLIEPVYFAAVAGTVDFERHSADFLPFEQAFNAGDMERAAQVFTELWGDGTPWSDLSDAQRDALAARIHLIPEQAPGLYDDPGGVLAANALEKMDIPVLLVEGEESPPVISAILDVFAARLPRTSRLRVPGAGHMVPLTHAGEVAGAVRALIQEAS
nr:alpha/beta hydrolase [Actibacterium sp. 188UL27-1]